MVMTFRQAIGRLIRSPEDTGKIFLLDGKFRRIKEEVDFFLRKSGRKRVVLVYSFLFF